MAPNKNNNNQNKPPLSSHSSSSTSSSPNSKYIVDEVSVDKRRKIGNTKMPPANLSTRAANRQALAERNMGGDLPPSSGPPSTTGSDCGVTEFTKESIEALISERLKVKNKFNYKEKCDQMGDFIKRLKECVKWFQQLEKNYVSEIEKLKDLLEANEKKCNEIELLMKAKEEELNSIIMELRRNYEASQEKFAKEQSDKLEAMDSFTKEKEARLSGERLQASLSEDLNRAQREIAGVNQKIQSLNDLYKRTQEYNTSLQRYNIELQEERDTANDALKRVEKEKAAVVENLSTLRGHHTSLQEQLTSLQEQLTSSRNSQEEAVRQKEVLSNKVGCLQSDTQQLRDDRDRQLLKVQALTEKLTEYREFIGRSAADLRSEIVMTEKLEGRCLYQSEQIRKLQEQLAFAEKKSVMSDMSAPETRTEFEEQKKFISELQNRLADAEMKILEGEKLRKKLHNTILVWFLHMFRTGT